jgi:hypothetical protein
MRLRPSEPMTLGTTPLCTFTLKCFACGQPADTLFGGTSYCQSCIREKTRTGTI